MNYRTLDHMSNLIRMNLSRIPKVDCVVGIPRSGMIAAAQIATLTHQPLASIHEVMNGSWGPSRRGGRWGGTTAGLNHILVVDDSVNGGETMQEVVGNIKKILPNANIETLAVYVNPVHASEITYPLELVDRHVFQWNWFKIPRIKKAVLDIDGVISTETTPGEREKGVPLFIPQRVVLAIATGRDESEREVTEKWLASHGIRYGKLFMSNPGRKAHATKIIAARETKATWVVESSLWQAERIHIRTGLPVLCTDANRMFT